MRRGLFCDCFAIVQEVFIQLIFIEFYNWKKNLNFYCSIILFMIKLCFIFSNSLYKYYCILWIITANVFVFIHFYFSTKFFYEIFMVLNVSIFSSFIFLNITS